jgi:hypothetical protein
MAVVFWTCVLFVAYSYVGYGCALALMSRVRNRPVRRAPITPSVSFIIAAHNEAKRITEKIENTLRQDYPSDRFEIIVASDGSTDATDEIVRSYADRRVRLIRPDQRRGKEYAQRTAIAAARGEVLVFSDVATRLDPDGVRQIVMSFDDPSVGCVSSVDRMIGSDGRPSGEGGYVRYEMQLRALESRVGSLVGLSGSFFAARREVCTPWPVDIPSDFTTVLNAVTRGLRGVSDGNAIGYYTDLADTSKEYSRKVRTVVRGISALLTHRALLAAGEPQTVPMDCAVRNGWRTARELVAGVRLQLLSRAGRFSSGRVRPRPAVVALADASAAGMAAGGFPAVSERVDPDCLDAGDAGKDDRRVDTVGALRRGDDSNIHGQGPTAGARHLSDRLPRGEVGPRHAFAGDPPIGSVAVSWARSLEDVLEPRDKPVDLRADASLSVSGARSRRAGR